MANTHRYGFRFARSFDGNETPQTITKPIASAYAPNTGADGAGGTACNLNIGDPVQLLNDGTVKAWGENEYGQLGNGSTTDSNVPVTVTGLSGITAIAAGGSDSWAACSSA